MVSTPDNAQADNSSSHNTMSAQNIGKFFSFWPTIQKQHRAYALKKENEKTAVGKASAARYEKQAIDATAATDKFNIKMRFCNNSSEIEFNAPFSLNREKYKTPKSIPIIHSAVNAENSTNLSVCRAPIFCPVKPVTSVSNCMQKASKL